MFICSGFRALPSRCTQRNRAAALDGDSPPESPRTAVAKMDGPEAAMPLHLGAGVAGDESSRDGSIDSGNNDGAAPSTIHNIPDATNSEGGEVEGEANDFSTDYRRGKRFKKLQKILTSEQARANPHNLVFEQSPHHCDCACGWKLKLNLGNVALCESCGAHGPWRRSRKGVH